MPIKTEPTRENAGFIILNAVALHERQLGIGGLALVLKGSKNKRIFDKKLYMSRFFGALFYRPVDIIENFIRQLLRMDLLATMDLGISYPFPVLVLTPAGRKALEDKLFIQLVEERTLKPVILNESVRITLELFKQLKNVSAVAEKRGLAESTIWTHLITAVKLGLLKAADVVDEQKVRLIIETRARLKPKGLKELKAALPENFTYEEIRCTMADAVGGNAA